MKPYSLARRIRAGSNRTERVRLDAVDFLASGRLGLVVTRSGRETNGLAIAPSKLGRFVVQKGFSWPTNKPAAPRDVGAADETLVRRLREARLVRPEATDGEVAETFQAARSEHAAGGYSPFNSPNERVRVFLGPYLTQKGRQWAEPLKSLDLPDDDSGREAQSWWKFWKR